jgi:hypothetical protein
MDILPTPPLDLEALRVLGVLGARYIVAAPEVSLDALEPQTLRTVYSGADATIAVNDEAVPRAYVPERVIVTPGERATDDRIAEAAFDPRMSVAVERDQPGAEGLARGAPTRGSVTIARERNASVTLSARLERRGLVVLDAALVEGWSVRVDDRPARSLYVNGVMRGVIVPAGRHEIVWSYAVPGLRLGVLLSVATFALLVAAAVLLGARSRRLRDRVPQARRAPMLRA